jgi:hypothetical protein
MNYTPRKVFITSMFFLILTTFGGLYIGLAVQDKKGSDSQVTNPIDNDPSLLENLLPALIKPNNFPTKFLIIGVDSYSDDAFVPLISAWGLQMHYQEKIIQLSPFYPISPISPLDEFSNAHNPEYIDTGNLEKFRVSPIIEEQSNSIWDRIIVVDYRMLTFILEQFGLPANESVRYPWESPEGAFALQYQYADRLCNTLGFLASNEAQSTLSELFLSIGGSDITGDEISFLWKHYADEFSQWNCQISRDF